MKNNKKKLKNANLKSQKKHKKNCFKQKIFKLELEMLKDFIKLVIVYYYTKLNNFFKKGPEKAFV